MEKYLDITKPGYSEQILPVPWHFVILRFHRTEDLCALADFIDVVISLLVFVLILFVKNIVYSCHFIQERKAGMASIKVSRLHLVDLAGSERQKDTHAEGLRLKVSNAYELIFMIFMAYLKNKC